MKKINWWKKANEPYWTPLGTMGWMAWAMSIICVGRERFIMQGIVFLVIICWMIREIEKIDKQNLTK